MKTLSLILLCLLSVGAWGQTGIVTTEAIVFEPPNPYTCTCTFSADGSSMSCAPAKACVKFIHADEDVPAIQEDYTLYVESTNCRVAPECKNSKDPMCNIAICDNVNHTEKRWTCRDKSRTLMQTEDGKTHYCHKAQLGH